MQKRIMHLFIVFVIGLCLSLPVTVSAATSSTTVTDPAVPPTDQCTETTQKNATSTTTVEGEEQSTDNQTETPTGDGCSEWQTAPVSWNS